ncbi:MAG TPA: ATP-binding protein, partial [Pseudonocardia sp.]
MMRRRDSPPATSRSAAQLLNTFAALPETAHTGRQRPEQGGRQERVNRMTAPKRGHARPGRGWSPVPAPLTVYQAATSEIGGLFPLLPADSLPAVGARMGYDVLSGGAFHCHPVEWVLRGIATNPNVVIFGEPGRGKSSTVVALLLRMM